MRDNTDRLRFLSLGLEKKVQCYNEFFINEYVFHTEKYGDDKKTYNSEVCVNVQLPMS
jgi:hypothetical protein